MRKFLAILAIVAFALSTAWYLCENRGAEMSAERSESSFWSDIFDEPRVDGPRDGSPEESRSDEWTESWPADATDAIVSIAGTDIFVLLAETRDEHILGLSWRDALAPDQGMLFVYSQEQTGAYWMHGMNFPLDFVWIRDGIIVDLDENVPINTDGESTTVYPDAPYDHVLEVSAGSINAHGWEIGDVVEIP